MSPKHVWGLVQLFTGQGKGKTTAALGTVLRALAKGKKAVIVYFDKGGASHYSEREFLRARMPEVEVLSTGLDRIDPATGRFRFGVTEEDKKEGKRGLEIVRMLFQKEQHDLIVLDEINSSAHLGILDEEEVLFLLKQKPKKIELILTGRNAPESFRALADLVTDMRLVKHYFYQGIAAREGLDY